MKFLLSFGAVPHVGDSFTLQSPLHYAAICFRANIVSLLLACHADPRYSDNCGATAAQFIRLCTPDVIPELKQIEEDHTVKGSPLAQHAITEEEKNLVFRVPIIESVESLLATIDHDIPSLSAFDPLPHTIRTRTLPRLLVFR